MSQTPGAQEKFRKFETLPTGTVTFLFTDIEGSTQRWEQHREAMEAAVVLHERVLTAAIQQRRGYVFKTVGDAFCAVFATASDALLAAVDAQRDLGKEDFSAVAGLKVRMGVHTGYAEERNADYFGPAVNRVARLMSLGHGGQVLISDITRGLANNDPPNDIALIDLGSHRLKDLTMPEHIWQLVIEGLPTQFPALKSLDALPNNLSIQRTSLVGRDCDVADVKKLVGLNRLVTLVGHGGVGKTRVALQVGADLLDQYPDGVWFVDFAAISDPELVPSIIAQVLGMSQQHNRRLDESIPLWLRHKKLLLILDNCEHVLQNVAALAMRIIGTGEDVRIMSTSRQVLGISGEQIFRVPPLAVPDNPADLTPAAITEFGAIALFVDRAKSVDRSFALTADKASIVVDICRQLDGIPLAIELAAARVKVLSIPNLAQRLNERFKILTGSSRDVLPRQQTLSALIGWSYDLLSPEEQALFRQLGIFAGGFGLQAATKICGDSLDEIDILNLLGSLVDKSLVVADTTSSHERYHLLESTRAYTLQKLEAAERERLARRHAQHYAEKAQEADKRYGTGSTFAWLADVGLELGNYRAALEWALTQGHDAALGGVIAGALFAFWREQGLPVEGRYWIESALQRLQSEEPSPITARLLRAQANFFFGNRMREVAERAVAMYEAIADRHGAAYARNILALGLYQAGDFDTAMNVLTEAAAVMRAYNDQFGTTNSLDLQANIVRGLGRLSEARELNAKALAAYKSVGSELDIALSLTNIAELEFVDGHPEAALRAASDALAIHQRSGVDSVSRAIDNINIGAYRIALNDLDGALKSAREGLRIARQVEGALYSAIALQHLALVLALRRQPRIAARLVGYVDAQYKAQGIEREYTERWLFEKLMGALSEQLNKPAIEKLAAEGAALSEDQAVEEALKV